MVIDDHINAMGAHPLIGPHDPVWGPRFADQSRVYDMRLRALIDASAAGIGERVTHGVYAAVGGPTYETPAEAAALRRMGADAVGMSTVPEAVLANAAGLEVAALSCITNKAANAHAEPLAHEEVIAETARAAPRLRSLLLEILRRMAAAVSRGRL
jgi:purine-nucleoside phosphorylase